MDNISRCRKCGQSMSVSALVSHELLCSGNPSSKNISGGDIPNRINELNDYSGLDSSYTRMLQQSNVLESRDAKPSARAQDVSERLKIREKELNNLIKNREDTNLPSRYPQLSMSDLRPTSKLAASGSRVLDNLISDARNSIVQDAADNPAIPYYAPPSPLDRARTQVLLQQSVFANPEGKQTKPPEYNDPSRLDILANHIANERQTAFENEDKSYLYTAKKKNGNNGEKSYSYLQQNPNFVQRGDQNTYNASQANAIERPVPDEEFFHSRAFDAFYFPKRPNKSDWYEEDLTPSEQARLASMRRLMGEQEHNLNNEAIDHELAQRESRLKELEQLIEQRRDAMDGQGFEELKQQQIDLSNKLHASEDELAHLKNLMQSLKPPQEGEALTAPPLLDPQGILQARQQDEKFEEACPSLPGARGHCFASPDLLGRSSTGQTKLHTLDDAFPGLEIYVDGLRLPPTNALSCRVTVCVVDVNGRDLLTPVAAMSSLVSNRLIHPVRLYLPLRPDSSPRVFKNDAYLLIAVEVLDEHILRSLVSARLESLTPKTEASGKSSSAALKVLAPDTTIRELLLVQCAANRFPPNSQSGLSCPPFDPSTQLEASIVLPLPSVSLLRDAATINSIVNNGKGSACRKILGYHCSKLVDRTSRGWTARSGAFQCSLHTDPPIREVVTKNGKPLSGVSFLSGTGNGKMVITTGTPKDCLSDTPVVPLTSILLRIDKAPVRNGRVLNRQSVPAEEWGLMGLDKTPPSLDSGEYSVQQGALVSYPQQTEFAQKYLLGSHNSASVYHSVVNNRNNNSIMVGKSLIDNGYSPATTTNNLLGKASDTLVKSFMVEMDALSGGNNTMEADAANLTSPRKRQATSPLSIEDAALVDSNRNDIRNLFAPLVDYWTPRAVSWETRQPVHDVSLMHDGFLFSPLRKVLLGLLVVLDLANPARLSSLPHSTIDEMLQAFLLLQFGALRLAFPPHAEVAVASNSSIQARPPKFPVWHGAVSAPHFPNKPLRIFVSGIKRAPPEFYLSVHCSVNSLHSLAYDPPVSASLPRPLSVGSSTQYHPMCFSVEPIFKDSLLTLNTDPCDVPPLLKSTFPPSLCNPLTVPLYLIVQVFKTSMQTLLTRPPQTPQVIPFGWTIVALNTMQPPATNFFDFVPNQMIRSCRVQSILYDYPISIESIRGAIVHQILNAPLTPLANILFSPPTVDGKGLKSSFDTFLSTTDNDPSTTYGALNNAQQSSNNSARAKTSKSSGLLFNPCVPVSTRTSIFIDISPPLSDPSASSPITTDDANLHCRLSHMHEYPPALLAQVLADPPRPPAAFRNTIGEILLGAKELQNVASRIGAVLNAEMPSLPRARSAGLASSSGHNNSSRNNEGFNSNNKPKLNNDYGYENNSFNNNSLRGGVAGDANSVNDGMSFSGGGGVKNYITGQPFLLPNNEFTESNNNYAGGVHNGAGNSFLNQPTRRDFTNDARSDFTGNNPNWAVSSQNAFNPFEDLPTSRKIR